MGDRESNHLSFMAMSVDGIWGIKNSLESNSAWHNESSAFLWAKKENIMIIIIHIVGD